MIQAHKSAMEAAKKLAEDARNAKGSLKQVFANRPDLPVVIPEPFSWLTFGQVPLGSDPTAARLNDVSGVDMAGEEFMATVFRLKPGEIGVAMNAPKTIACVIRLIGLQPSEDVLWSQFKVDDFSKYEAAVVEAQRQTYTAWLNELKTSANLKWTPIRTTDQQQEGRQGSPSESRNESDEG